MPLCSIGCERNHLFITLFLHGDNLFSGGNRRRERPGESGIWSFGARHSLAGRARQHQPQGTLRAPGRVLAPRLPGLAGLSQALTGAHSFPLSRFAARAGAVSAHSPKSPHLSSQALDRFGHGGRKHLATQPQRTPRAVERAAGAGQGTGRGSSSGWIGN